MMRHLFIALMVCLSAATTLAVYLVPAPHLHTVNLSVPSPVMPKPWLAPIKLDWQLPDISLPSSPDVVAMGWRWRSAIEHAATERFGGTEHVARFAAQIHQESKWNSDVTSHAGAQGMAQFMRPTANAIARLHPDLSPADPTNPSWAIRAQAALLADISARFVGETPCDTWAFRLSAYNGGEKRLVAEKVLAGNPEAWFGVSGVEPQISRRKSAWIENRGYVRRILLTLEPTYLKAGFPGKAVCI